MTEIVEYDQSWTEAYISAADDLLAAGKGEWRIEHIGSTSIPGLLAKPIIDLAVRLVSFDELDDRRKALAANDWFAIRRQPRSHRVMVRDVGGKRTHIAHFFTSEQWETCHQRLFRDWLRTHPEDLSQYRAVKLKAATGDPGDYTRVKEPVVLDIVNRARIARDLAPIEELDSDA